MNRNKNENNNNNKDGMSSELQAKLQKRLAKCTIEEETDDKNATTAEATVTVESEEARRKDSRKNHAYAAALKSNSNISKSTKVTSSNNKNVTKNIQERYTSNFKSLSVSTTNHSNPNKSSTTSIYKEAVTSPLSSSTSTKSVLSYNSKTPSSSRNHNNISSGYSSQSSGSIFNFKSIKTEDSHHNNEDSPFDEQISDSPSSSKHNQNKNIYHNVILKKTKVNLNKELFTRDEPSISVTTNKSNSQKTVEKHGIKNTTSIKKGSTGGSNNIQQHPYLKRYSPVPFAEREDKDNHGKDNEQKSSGNSGLQQHPYLQQYLPTPFQTDTTTNVKNEVVGEKSFTSSYAVTSNVTNVDNTAAKGEATGGGYSANNNVAKPKRYSPTFWNDTERLNSQSSSNKQHTPTLTPQKVGQSTALSTTKIAKENNVVHPPEGGNNTSTNKSINTSSSNNNDKQSSLFKPISSTIPLSLRPTSPLLPASPSQTALSASHVNAMKKLFNKTNPQPPPPPPPSLSPLLSAHQKKSLPQSRTMKIKTSKDIEDQKEENTTKKSLVPTLSSSSYLSQDGVEMTIDNYKLTFNNEKDENRNVDNDSSDESNSESHGGTETADGTKAFPKSDELLIVDDNVDEIRETDINDIFNFQDNTNFASIAAFEAVTDWPGDITNSDVYNDNNQPITALMSDKKHTQPSSFTEPHNDWSKEPSTFSSMFDQTFTNETGGNDNKIGWDWPSNKTDNNDSKQDPFSPKSFFQFDSNFDDAKQAEGIDDSVLIIEDEFDDEPDVNPDCLDDDIIMKTIPIAKLSNSHIGAVMNPLSKNLVVCHQRNGDQWFIDEIDPRSSGVISSINISTSAIRHKIASSTYTSQDGANLKRHIISGIENVLKISIGLHRHNNRLRARVAALLQLSVLGCGDNNDTLCVVAVWQWGYATSGCTIMLQNVISSPPKDCFEPKSLCFADGLVFFAGTSMISTKQSSVPVIYTAKPHVGDQWTINIVTNESSHSSADEIVYMSVAPFTNRLFNLLAVAFNDGTLSIWTYDKALTSHGISKERKGTGYDTQQQLQVFCNLNGSSKFERFQQTISTSYESDDDQGKQKDEQYGNCCHISWMNSCLKTSTYILLAAAFLNGVEIYIVPTSGANDFPLQPLSVMKTDHVYQRCMVSWIEIPKYPPCLSILLSNSIKSLMIYGIMGIPIKDVELINYTEVPFHKICEDEVPIGSTLPWTDMYSFDYMKAIISCENGNITQIIPSSRYNERQANFAIHPSLYLLTQPVASNAIGTTSMGFVEKDISADNVLHIHSQLTWKKLSDNDSRSMKANVVPVMSQSLCKTNAGDRNIVRKTKDGSFEDRGGAKTELVCELKCHDPIHPHMIPTRVVRSNFDCLCAIFLVPLFASNNDRKIKVHESAPEKFSFINFGEDNIETVQHLDGRDVVFLDNKPEKKMLILDKDGVNLEERLIISDNTIHQRKVRIFRRGSSHDERLVTHRVFTLSSGSLILLSSRRADSRHLLLLGGKVNQVTKECFIDGKTSKCWLHEGERFLSLVELPTTDSPNIKIAVSTTSRILILCCYTSLNIVSEYTLNSFCTSLAPLGSSCVSFLESESNQQRIRYLSCNIEEPTVGTIANLPVSASIINLLLAIRPDRAVYNSIITECNDYIQIIVPIPLTKPLFLLEPLVANIIGENYSKTSANSSDFSPALDVIIERFGAKTDSNPHTENEGVGTKGIGYTIMLLQMLRSCGRYDDFLTKHLNKGENLFPWIPSTEKLDEVQDYEEIMNFISDGDENLLDYVKTCDMNKSCVLPKPLDPLSYVLSSIANKALDQNRLDSAIRAMDVLGSSSSDHDLATILRLNQISSPKKAFINATLPKSSLRNFDNSRPLSFTKSVDQAQNLSQEEQKQSEMVERKKIFMPQLAPIYQRGICQTGRASNYLIENTVIQVNNQNMEYRNQNTTIDDLKNVWYCGPFGKQEEILLLDNMDQWFGRRRPTVLGKEGADIAAESGQMTLQNILAAAAATTPTELEAASHPNESQCSSMEGWEEGVGEGQTDGDKLTLYLRFFEGADEDLKWKEEGFSDLSTFQNKPKLLNTEFFELEATTSNVDEGEEGSVRLLHDLVWKSDTADEEVAGLFFEVKRGSSLDIGMFHSAFNRFRQRATLEFWYYLPRRDLEIVLARRSICPPHDADIESLCCKAEKETMLWELVVLPSGRLEFHSCGGDVLNTSNNRTMENEQSSVKNSISLNADDSYAEDVDTGLVSWPRSDGYGGIVGGWNHVALTFTCDDLEENECKVSIAMKGIEIISSTVTFEFPKSCLDEDGSLDIEDALNISALMFGVGAVDGFRLTELRVWAFARPIDDLNMMMYEYLDAAKIKKKKKFKMAIRKKENTKQKAMGISITPPRETFKPRKLVTTNENETSIPWAVDINESTVFHNEESFADFDDSMINANNSVSQKENGVYHDYDTVQSKMEVAENPEEEEEVAVQESSTQAPIFRTLESCLLSDDVRKSAAAAMIRGGPATRHFGGNRGGLPEEEINIGSVAICGAQKTVILSHGRSPRGKTYPIGASGAIISDLLDLDDTGANYQEFLCCFLAKDKRMVVFELKSKNVIVELQMTTKLNFWRWLSPIADGNNLVFFLLTPIGGFHWLPLSESPHPRQVWKRGPGLQGKKIVSYEEGGSNGMQGNELLSSVALVLSYSNTADDAIEAWCVTLSTETQLLCVSKNVLGAALYCTPSMASPGSAFYPLVLVAIETGETEISIELHELLNDPFRSKEINVRAICHLNQYDEVYDIPPMAMGPLPPILCLCWDKFIIIIVRDRGLLVYYEFLGNSMNLVLQHDFKRYVVDAGIQTRRNEDGIEVVVLLCESNKKDGRIVTLSLK